MLFKKKQIAKLIMIYIRICDKDKKSSVQSRIGQKNIAAFHPNDNHHYVL